MRDGNFVVGVTTINQRGEKVLEGTAEVAQPTTVYAFTVLPIHTLPPPLTSSLSR
jgi:hypothetical protein